MLLNPTQKYVKRKHSFAYIIIMYGLGKKVTILQWIFTDIS